MYFLPTDEFECFESGINRGVTLPKPAGVIFAFKKVFVGAGFISSKGKLIILASLLSLATINILQN